MKIALGTVQFGLNYGVSNTSGQPSQQEVKAILSLAQQHNISMLDTAVAYGNSEQIIGQSYPNHSCEFDIVTKISFDPNNSQAQLNEQISASRQRLHQQNLYAVLLHNTNSLTDQQLACACEQLSQLKLRDQCQKIGVSVYHPEQLFRIIEKIDINIVQFPLNIFDQRFNQAPLIKELKKQNIEIHTRSLFLQGLLLMEPTYCPSYFNPYQPLLTKLFHYCAQQKITQLAACLAFAKAATFVDKFVIGVNSSTELAEIISTYNKVAANNFAEFSSEKLGLLDPSLWPPKE